MRGIHRSPRRPVTRSLIFFDLCLNKRLNKQSWGWCFETPSRSLRHCNDYCLNIWCWFLLCRWSYQHNSVAHRTKSSQVPQQHRVQKLTKKVARSTKRKIIICDPWKRCIPREIDKVLKFLPTCITFESSFIMHKPEVRKYINYLHDRLVVVPVDKASNNFGTVCKSFYFDVIKNELRISDGGNIIGNTVYKPIYQKPNDVYKFSSTLGMKLLDIDQHIPLLCWTSKQQKSNQLMNQSINQTFRHDFVWWKIILVNEVCSHGSSVHRLSLWKLRFFMIVVTFGAWGCHTNKLRCLWWRQSWHDYRFSVPVFLSGIYNLRTPLPPQLSHFQKICSPLFPYLPSFWDWRLYYRIPLHKFQEAQSSDVLTQSSLSRCYIRHCDDSDRM